MPLDQASIDSAVAALTGSQTSDAPAAAPTDSTPSPAAEAEANSAQGGTAPLAQNSGQPPLPTPTPPGGEAVGAAPEPKPEAKPMDLHGAKERALLKKDQEIARARQELATREQAIKAQEARMQQIQHATEAAARGDYGPWLALGGLQNQSRARYLAEGRGDEIKPEAKKEAPEEEVSEKEAKLLERIEQLERAHLEAAQAAQQAETKSTLMADKSRFKYLNRLGNRGVDQVYQLVQSHFRDNGELPGDGTFSDAVRLVADAVEKGIRDDMDLLTKEDEPSTVPSVASKTATPGPQANSGTKVAPTTTTNSQAAALPPRNGMPFEATLEYAFEEAKKMLPG